MNKAFKAERMPTAGKWTILDFPTDNKISIVACICHILLRWLTETFHMCVFITSMSTCCPQESDMPEEVNIDDLLDLPNEEERVKKLQVIWPVAFIAIFSTSAWDKWTCCFVLFFISDQINKVKNTRCINEVGIKVQNWAGRRRHSSRQTPLCNNKQRHLQINTN